MAGKKIKVKLQDGTIRELDTSSKEYKDLYATGKIAGSKDGVYSRELPNVGVSAIRKKTVWDKVAEESKDMGPLALMTYGPAAMAMGIPQLLATEKITGKYQRPSEAMNIKNPIAKMAIDIGLDPVNLAFPALGALGKGLSMAPGIGIDAPELGYHALNSSHWALNPEALGGSSVDKLVAYTSAAANRLLPLWQPFKDPLMKQNSFGKKVIEHIMKQSSSPSRSLGDIRKAVTNAFLNKKPGLYDGTLNVDQSKRIASRNAIDMYLKGPKAAPGFKEISQDVKTIDFGDFYKKAHPDQKYYEMSSEIPNKEPVYSGYNNLEELIRTRNTENILKEGSSGIVGAKDDVAGYVEALRFDEAGNPTVISQDHWGFLGNYANKWANKRASGPVLVDDIIAEKQAALLNKVGKPFYLVQNNPVTNIEPVRKISNKTVYNLDETSFNADDWANGGFLDFRDYADSYARPMAEGGDLDYTGMGVGFMNNKPQTVNKDWLYPNRQDYIGGAPMVGGIVGKVGQVAAAYRGLNYFRPNPKMMYRGIGREGYLDAIESGVFRARPYEKLPVQAEKLPLDIHIKQKTFDKTYYTPSTHAKFLRDKYAKGYMAEVPIEGNNFRFRYGSDKPWSQLTSREIPISEGKIYKKDWLRDWKDISPNKSEGGYFRTDQDVHDYGMGSWMASGAQGALTGAAAGSVVPGWGTAAGAAVGFATGVAKGIMGDKKAQREDEAIRQRELQSMGANRLQQYNNQPQQSYLPTFAEGGDMTQTQQEPVQRNIKITDNRKTNIATGEPLQSNRRKNAEIPQDAVESIIYNARKHGVDPATALAIGLQETNFRPDSMSNPFMMGNYNPYGDIIDESMKFMSEKNKYAKKLGKKTDEDIIQAYNGYGTVRNAGKMYGIDTAKSPIDMNTNPLYGKTVKQLRDSVIMQNPEILKMLGIKKALGGNLDDVSQMQSYGYNLMAAGGHLMEGNSTLKEAKEFMKLYPKEMAFGTETEYEHTGNKKLAQRIAADHVKDSIKMNQGGEPDYYKKLQEAGISDELNKLPVMANGGKLSANKAKEMLKDGKVHGKPLTDRQKRYFGFIAGGGAEKKAHGGPLPAYENILNSLENRNYNVGGYFGTAYSVSGGINEGISFNKKDVTEYKGGGTHEQNGLGGIPIGQKARVEDGEVRVDFDEGSYIFSNRF